MAHLPSGKRYCDHIGVTYIGYQTTSKYIKFQYETVAFGCDSHEAKQKSVAGFRLIKYASLPGDLQHCAAPNSNCFRRCFLPTVAPCLRLPSRLTHRFLHSSLDVCGTAELAMSITEEHYACSYQYCCWISSFLGKSVSDQLRTSAHSAPCWMANILLQ